MSAKARNVSRNSLQRRATIFAALGDPTRLSLVDRLAVGEPHSISQLTENTDLSRQAVTKHLRVLEKAGVVRSLRSGRENLFAFEPRAFKDMKEYLEFVACQWEDALLRLKAFVEE